MFEIDLSKRAILITGALGAIAQHVVYKLREAGAYLVLTDKRTEHEARRTLDSWGVSSTGWTYRQMDVTDATAVDLVVQDVIRQFPNLDTVLGHAGGCELHPFEHTSQEEFDKIFSYNFLSQTYLARAVVQAWRGNQIPGHLIFTSSYVARAPHTRIPAYASAKAALEHFTRCLALEYAGYNIRINSISPGNVAAGSSQRSFDEDREYRDFVLRVSPMGRRNSPESVADVFVFLCSPMAKEITGQVISVDTGVSIPKIG